MTERSLVVRFSTKDSETVKRALNSLGDEGQRALRKIENAAKGPNTALRLISNSSRELQGSMESLASRAGSLGTAIAGLGPVGLAAAAAIGGVTVAVGIGLKAYAEAERAQLRLQGVFRATGGAAGLSAAQVAEYADELERTTFVTKEQFLQAAAVLGTFKSVSGDTFKQAISLASDMAEVFGGDVSSAATQLGKALESPTEGLTALRRVGVTFTEEQKALILSLDETGKKAEAQRVILDALAGQLGGAAKESASGLAGAVDNLGDSFGDLFEAIGEIANDKLGVRSYFEGVGDAIDGITAKIYELFGVIGRFSDLQLVDKIGEATLRSKEVERAIAGYEKAAGAGGIGGASASNALAASRREQEQLRAEIAKYQSELDKRAATFKDGLEKSRRKTESADDEAKAQDKVEKSVARTAKASAAVAKETRESRRAMEEFTVAQREAERRARELEKAQEEAARPFIQAGERIQDAFADAFENIFSGGVNSFSDLGAAIRKIMLRTASEVAAAMVFKPVIGGAIGSVFPSFGGSASGGYASGASGSSGGGVGSLASNVGGLSSAYNFLSGASGANLGGLFARASLYSGIGSPTTAQLIGNYFTPAAGLAGFGGNFLANALFGNRGIGATIGGTAGGIGGTVLGSLAGSGAFGSTLGGLLGSWGGPVGALAGSFLGNAIGGLFGGKKKNPAASFGGVTDASGMVGGLSYRSKHMGNEAVQGIAGQIGALLQVIGGASGRSLAGMQISGAIDAGRGSFVGVNGRRFGFNSNDESSLAEAMRQLALYASQAAGVVDKSLLGALQNVTTKGRSAGEVIQAVAARLEYISGLKSFQKQLQLDTNTSTQSPEAIFQQLRTDALQTFQQAFVGNANAQGRVQQVAADYLNSAVGYFGRGTSGYDQAAKTVQAYLDLLINRAPPGYASGGVASGTFLAGERGPELITVGRPSRVYDANRTRSMLRGGDDALAAEFRAYRSQSASETFALRESLAGLQAEMSKLTGLMRRAVTA